MDDNKTPLTQGRGREHHSVNRTSLSLLLAEDSVDNEWPMDFSDDCISI